MGVGTDAAVFRHRELTDVVFKVYSSQATVKKETEESVYLRLGKSPYFPALYGKGSNYIVLSYEEGITLFDCLVEGIEVPEQAIQDVEEARRYTRSIGLNPRDIHLKNVLLQQGRGKVIDVSEYARPGNDQRWEHLLWGYRFIYPYLRGRKVPVWVLEAIKRFYKGLALLFRRRK